MDGWMDGWRADGAFGLAWKLEGVCGPLGSCSSSCGRHCQRRRLTVKNRPVDNNWHKRIPGRKENPWPGAPHSSPEWARRQIQPKYSYICTSVPTLEEFLLLFVGPTIWPPEFVAFCCRFCRSLSLFSSSSSSSSSSFSSSSSSSSSWLIFFHLLSYLWLSDFLAFIIQSFKKKRKENIFVVFVSMSRAAHPGESLNGAEAKIRPFSLQFTNLSLN